MLPASLPGLHALLSPALANVFEALGISATLRDKADWYALHGQPNLVNSEVSHGQGVDRNYYNVRMLAQVEKTLQIAMGQHRGVCDFFVPIGSGGTLYAILVTGPFLLRRPTSADLLERWHSLTGRHGHPSDPEFSHYISLTLSTLVLEGEQLGRYERFLTCFAELCATRGDARALAAEAAALRAKLEGSRFPERAWSEARCMVDPGEEGGYFSPHKATDLEFLGFSAPPEHVLVGLSMSSPDDPDPVGAILRRDAFQRACVELAYKRKNAISGRVGQHGVSFVAAGAGSSSRTRRALTDLADQAAALGRRRFGLKLHFGMSSTSGRGPLSVRYQEALAQAERAISEGVTVAVSGVGSLPKGSALRRLRQELGTIAVQRPQELAPRFDRYIEAASTSTGYQLELMRAVLDSAFERVAEAFFGAQALEAKGYEDLFETLEREARLASSVAELVAAYRRAIADLAAAAEHPVQGARDRKLRRALAFIEAHYTEPIRLPQVSKLAGFAPRYFAKLFKQRQRTTFGDYVTDLRVERAKQLLIGTDLSIERIAELSGFRFRPYFHRAFKRVTRMTPDVFRSTQS